MGEKSLSAGARRQGNEQIGQGDIPNRATGRRDGSFRLDRNAGMRCE